MDLRSVLLDADRTDPNALPAFDLMDDAVRFTHASRPSLPTRNQPSPPACERRRELDFFADVRMRLDILMDFIIYINRDIF